MYKESCKKIRARIAKIDAQIDALEDAMLNGAGNADIMVNALDTGQTRSSQTYRDPGQIEATIAKLERRKQSLINDLNGYGHRAMDIKNF